MLVLFCVLAKLCAHTLNASLHCLPSRRPDYLHSIKHRQPRTIPRQAPHLAYERSVGFASIAIVVVCGRCVLHRLGSTTYKHPCLNSGRSISGILARPLPKGAGLRQDSIVSNISIFSDTHNAPILQTLSAVKTEGSPASNLSASAITSANNPSVTVPKNSVLYQYIFNLILTAIPKMLYRTVTAPFTQGSWLAARLACFKYYYYSRQTQRPNHTKFICRQD